MIDLSPFVLKYEHARFSNGLVVHADCFEWLHSIPDNSIDAVVTDPPYGVKEYELEEIEKMLNNRAGVWRLPPSFDGNTRAPLPRFTALTQKERETLSRYFTDWARALLPKLKPGAHVLVASNSFMSQLVFSSIIAGGLEFRTEVIRLVQTMRGGDRPKLGEEEFSDVCALPRGAYEPWGLFRKPLPKGLTVRECLRKYGTGGLRRIDADRPFFDVIPSGRTSKFERSVANHPSLKPQALMRQLVHSMLPLGTGVIVDTFAGSGSTIAAAEAVGYQAIGVERHKDYFDLAVQAIPKLAQIDATEIKNRHSDLAMQFDLLS
jgi:site-specific DNA-methyltransferase (adenine-specific)